MQLGSRQSLRVAREMPQGLYLSDGTEEVLLPRKFVPADTSIADELDVFVYTDSEDRFVATTEHPFAAVGEFAFLEVVSATQDGLFFDWGLEKDLFCPRKEQLHEPRPGDFHIVAIYLDRVSQRVACSMRWNRLLQKEGEGLEVGQKLPILIADRTPEGLVAIVDNRVRAMLFNDERVADVRVGDTGEAFVKQIRPTDGRVAISLRPQGHHALAEEADRLIDLLHRSGGRLPLSDHSSPQQIFEAVGLSKAAFKRLIGNLYRQGRIKILAEEIGLP